MNSSIRVIFYMISLCIAQTFSFAKEHKVNQHFAQISHSVQPHQEWSVQLSIVIENDTLVRQFGRHPDATLDFDNNMDELLPPPSPSATGYCYFRLNDYLAVSTEIRPTENAYLNCQDSWLLYMSNASNLNSVIRWDPDELPRERGIFTLSSQKGDEINMHKNDSMEIKGNFILTITQNYIEEYTLTFNQTGWYLISLPVQPNNTDVSVLFPVAHNGIAYEYLPLAEGYIQKEQIDPGTGYWIYALEPDTVSIKGVLICDYEKQINRNWNLVGTIRNPFPFHHKHSNPSGVILNRVWGWDLIDQQYTLFNELVPTHGYWLFSKQGTILTMDYASIDSTSMPASPDPELTELKPPPPPTLSTVEKRTKTNSILSLCNYPNPFNGRTSIDFELFRPSRVKLVIVNIFGQHIKTLLDTHQTSGEYTVSWDGKNDAGKTVSTGLYFVKLETNYSIQTHKLLLLN